MAKKPIIAAVLAAALAVPTATFAGPVHSWDGFYLGLAVGARISDTSGEATGLSNPPQPAFATPLNTDTFDATSTRIGGYFGYNWQQGHWILSLEADAGFAPSSKKSIDRLLHFNPAPGEDRTDVEHGYDASLRARLGLLLNPNLLAYATAGIAVQQLDVRMACTQNGSWCVATRSETRSTTLTGWTVGGGLEWKLGQWIARGEYRYQDYGSETFLFFANAPIDSLEAKFDTRSHIVSFGLGYRF